MAKERKKKREKQERLMIVDEKKTELKKRKIQTTISFEEKKLGEKGRATWEREVQEKKREERLELAEMKENLWRWRVQGKENTKKGKERKKETTLREMEEKLKRLENLIEKEKKDKKAQADKEEAAKKARLLESEKKRMRMERKRKEEEKWKTIKWVTTYLDENIEEFLEAVGEREEVEKSEKEEWERMKRFERIEALKSEQRWAEKRARLELESKLPPGKRVTPPGAEVKLKREDFEKPIRKELRRKVKFEKKMYEISRRVAALGEVTEGPEGENEVPICLRKEKSMHYTYLPVRLVNIFTSPSGKTGKLVQIAMDDELQGEREVQKCGKLSMGGEEMTDMEIVLGDDLGCSGHDSYEDNEQAGRVDMERNGLDRVQEEEVMIEENIDSPFADRTRI